MSDNIVPIELLREQNERLRLELDNKKMTQALEGWENPSEESRRRTLKEIQRDFHTKYPSKSPTLIERWKGKKS